jgi:hypothetical protein
MFIYFCCSVRRHLNVMGLSKAPVQAGEESSFGVYDLYPPVARYAREILDYA